MADFVAKAETRIKASPADVWDALIDPKQIKKFMFGSDVVTDWKPGSSIVWRGEYEGKKYEDKGEILEIDPERLLKMTHFSPLSGAEDIPANYHTLTYELEGDADGTSVSLSQDNNSNAAEADRFKSNWEKMLSALKEVVESN